MNFNENSNCKWPKIRDWQPAIFKFAQDHACLVYKFELMKKACCLWRLWYDASHEPQLDLSGAAGGLKVWIKVTRSVTHALV